MDETLAERVRALAARWERPLNGARQRANTGDDFAEIHATETLSKSHARELRALLDTPAPAPVGDVDVETWIEQNATWRTEGDVTWVEMDSLLAAIAAFAAAQRAEAEAYAAKCAAVTVRALDEKADEYWRAERAEAKLARVETALMQGGQTDRIRWSAAVAALLAADTDEARP